MNAGQELQTSMALLYDGLLSDCACALALAAQWCHPYAEEDEDPPGENWEQYWGQFEDDFQFGMIQHLVVHYIDDPDLYAALRYDVLYADRVERDLEIEIIDRLNKTFNWHGEFMELSELGAGIPLYFIGSGLTSYAEVDEEFFEATKPGWIANTLLLDHAFLSAFSDAENRFTYELVAAADQAFGRFVPELPEGQGHILEWFMGSSGNTVFDTSWEQAGEEGLDIPSWDRYAFIKSMMMEALDMQMSMLEALDVLETDDQALKAFCSNLLIAYAAGIQEVFDDGRQIAPRAIRHAGDRGRDAGEADPDLELLCTWDRQAAA